MNDYHVRVLVAVHISDCDSEWVRRNWKIFSRKLFLTVENQYLVFSPTINGNVGFLIAIKIGHCDAMRVRIAFDSNWRTWRRAELAFAVTEQYSDRPDFVIGDCQVNVAVAIEINRGNVGAVLTGGKRRA